MNLQTEQTEYEAPKTETGWSRLKKALGPVAAALDELLVGEVRPLRALDVAPVDKDFRH